MASQQKLAHFFCSVMHSKVYVYFNKTPNPLFKSVVAFAVQSGAGDQSGSNACNHNCLCIML